MKRLVLLGSSNPQSSLLEDRLRAKSGLMVTRYDSKQCFSKIVRMKPDVIVSYNFRYLIPVEVILSARLNAVNLHISYLPWNRGANPNYWSFKDGTPSGVSIHQLTEIIDRGPVLVRKIVRPSGADTLRSFYELLHSEIRYQFMLLLPKLLKKPMVGKVYDGGSYHSSEEKMVLRFGWDTRCSEVA